MTIRCKGCQKLWQRPSEIVSNVPETSVVMVGPFEVQLKYHDSWSKGKIVFFCGTNSQSRYALKEAIGLPKEILSVLFVTPARLGGSCESFADGKCQIFIGK
jgi:hypothetical protein